MCACQDNQVIPSTHEYDQSTHVYFQKKRVTYVMLTPDGRTDTRRTGGDSDSAEGRSEKVPHLLIIIHKRSFLGQQYYSTTNDANEKAAEPSQGKHHT